jgi:hypothetical protein
MENLLKNSIKYFSASMGLNIIPVNPMNIGDFKVQLVYPLLLKSEAVLLITDIKYSIDKITKKHCS